jgi:predicted nucleotidyltransferase
MKPVFISSDEKQIILAILQGAFDILVFGSRVTGTHQKFSDLDLCLKADKPIDRHVLGQFRTKFSESNLPYTIDLIDYHAIDKSFRDLIMRDAIDLRDAIPNQ